MAKRLDGLEWKPRWTSLMGALEGCADFLGLSDSPEWLFGCSGHAFVLNIGPNVCPSGPTAWRMGRMYTLCRNVAFEVDSVTGYYGSPDFSDCQAEAWQKVRQAIDQGLPCFGWEILCDYRI